MDDKHLIEAAQSTDNFTNDPFDVFLRENLYSEDDLSKVILMDELYFFYAFWFKAKYKKYPNKLSYSRKSLITKLHKTRQRNPEDTSKLKWGLKCSLQFKIASLNFKKENPGWANQVEKALAALKGHQRRRQRLRKKPQAEVEISMPHSETASTPESNKNSTT